MSGLLRAVRQQHGLTLEELATATGLTESYLSKVERQRSTPSISAAIKRAKTLEVDVAQTFSDDPEATTMAVERMRAVRKRHQPLASSMLGKSMSPFLVRPSRRFESHSHAEHSGQEFMFVHAGRVELEYGVESIELDTGDSVYLDASVTQRIRQTRTEPSVVVVVIQNQPAVR